MKIYFTSRNRSASSRRKIRNGRRGLGNVGTLLMVVGVCVPENQGDGGTSCYGLSICITLKFTG